jgi:SET domain-containing protein
MTINWPPLHSPEKISPVSWIADGIESQGSKIHGTGLFSRRKFFPDETIIILGGTIFSADEVKQGKAIDQSTTGYGEGFYIGKPALQRYDTPLLDDYVNHSCDPNLWLSGKLTILARRDIFPGEEITIDYSTWEIDEHWRLPGLCNCGSGICRRHVTGRDWRSALFQDRYKGHLLPCLADRVVTECNA